MNHFTHLPIIKDRRTNKLLCLIMLSSMIIFLLIAGIYLMTGNPRLLRLCVFSPLSVQALACSTAVPGFSAQKAIRRSGSPESTALYRKLIIRTDQKTFEYTLDYRNPREKELRWNSYPLLVDHLREWAAQNRIRFRFCRWKLCRHFDIYTISC